MKKRLLVVLLALSMATTNLVGCSFSIGNESSGSSVLDELKDKEDDKDSKKEKTDKDKENKKGKDKDKDQKDENVDWSKEYDNYFDKYSFEDGFEMTATTTEDGIDMDIVAGFAKNGSYVSIGMSYEDNDPTRIDMYNIDDKVYAYAEMMGESQWTYAIAESTEEVEELMGISGEMSEELDTSIFSKAKYEKEIEEDGVVYDILLLENETSTSRFYIDRETQEIEKLVIEQDGESIEYGLKDIDEVKLPKEAENAQEVTMEEIGMTFMAVLFGSMGSMDIDTSVDTDTDIDTNIDIDTSIENSDNETQNNDVDIQTSIDNLEFDENIVFNGDKYVLGETTPIDVKSNFGINFYDEEDLNLVINPDYYEGLWFYMGDDDEYTVWLYFANFTDEAKKLSDCTLSGLKVEASGYTNGIALGSDISFRVGNCITENISEQELLNTLGDPEYTYNSEEYNLNEYSYDLPIGASYSDTLYDMEIGYNSSGIYSFSYGIY